MATATATSEVAMVSVENKVATITFNRPEKIYRRRARCRKIIRRFFHLIFAAAAIHLTQSNANTIPGGNPDSRCPANRQCLDCLPDILYRYAL